MVRDQRGVKVVVDSAADIPHDIVAQLDITVVPLQLQMLNKSYRDGVDISGEAFYHELESTLGLATTSLPSVESFADVYRNLTNRGFDVVSVHMSSKLSGTYNAAVMAAGADGIPPEAVAVIDTRTICMSEGWCAIEAAEAAKAGRSIAEVAAVAENAASRAVLYGALQTLEYAIRSGRVSRLPGTLGTILQIKPILTMRPNGTAGLFERVRTHQKALQRLADLTLALGPLDCLAIMHGADPDGAAQLMEHLKTVQVARPVVVGHIGAVLGTHIGPGGVGVCCLKA